MPTGDTLAGRPRAQTVAICAEYLRKGVSADDVARKLGVSTAAIAVIYLHLEGG